MSNDNAPATPQLSLVRNDTLEEPYDGGAQSTVVHVVGTRPNFVKMAPVVAALQERGVFRQILVHTGQHYDKRMSDEVLADLDFPEPDYLLGVGSGSHGEQTAKVLERSSAC